jgi:multicomponent Na+:H+ antiporter subunit E
MRTITRYLPATLLLLVLYMLLTGNLQLSNLVVGFIVSAAVAVLVQANSFTGDVRRLPGAVWASIRYIGLVAWDVAQGGTTVARIVLNPRLPIRPGIVAIPSGCESELATALSAHALSVAPGELVVAISDEGVMYTHTLDVSAAEQYAEDAQRLRRTLLSKIIQ